ncbi:MAG: hypothetical protein Q9181_002299 [Wetmoreana brouardii]
MDPSQQPFLPKEPFSRLEDDIENRGKENSKPWLRNSTSPLFVHVILVTVYTIGFLYTTYTTAGSCHKGLLIYSPAQPAVQYEARPVDGLATDSIFAGAPTPQIDQAWHNLLASKMTSSPQLSSQPLSSISDINLRVTTDEMRRLNQTSLELADGSGHLATIGVYHELHCLKRTRKWMYKDHYYPNLTDLQHKEHEKHVGTPSRNTLLNLGGLQLIALSSRALHRIASTSCHLQRRHHSDGIRLAGRLVRADHQGRSASSVRKLGQAVCMGWRESGRPF